MEIIEALVIGSGPSGSIAALELINNGVRTTLIDQAEPGPISESKLLFQITRSPNLKIKSALMNDAERYFMDKSSRARKKLKFGHDIQEYPPISQESHSPSSIGIRSKSKGGFTEIWGAVINIPKSINALSFPERIWVDLASTYREILRELPTTQNFDSVLPFGIRFETKSDSDLFLTPLQIRLKAVKDSCPNLFIANLALTTSGDHACVGCQKCMMGCPVDAIYSTRVLIDRLIGRGLEYHPGTKVLGLSETPDGVIVTVSRNAVISELICKRVFLGAGPFGTAELLTNSIKINYPIEIRDTPIVYGIHFAWRVIDRKRPHSLCEIILDKSDLPKGIYAQFYTLESSTLGVFLGSKSFLKRLLMKTVLHFRKYLVVSITYLPAVDAFSYSKNGTMPTNSPDFNLKKSYLASITRSFLELKSVGIIASPVVFLVSEPGSSMHFGSSFPFSEKPQNRNKTSDEYGRVFDLQNVHIVDASILPDTIVGPPTLTIMANSMRIVRKVVKELE